MRFMAARPKTWIQWRPSGYREDFKSGVACYRCNCYLTPLGAVPEHAVTVEPAAHWAVSQRVDRDDRLEHRHLDARGGCRLVDDLALVVAVDGGARGGGGHSSGDAACAACRGDRRYRRSPQAADRRPGLFPGRHR